MHRLWSRESRLGILNILGNKSQIKYKNNANNYKINTMTFSEFLNCLLIVLLQIGTIISLYSLVQFKQTKVTNIYVCIFIFFYQALKIIEPMHGRRGE